MPIKKNDSNKTRYELIPPELLEQTARVLTLGAKKYSDRDWEQGAEWSRYFGALQRHLWAWWRGDEFDPETGESHLAHAACCLSFLVAYEQRAVGTDDRPNKVKIGTFAVCACEGLGPCTGTHCVYK